MSKSFLKIRNGTSYPGLSADPSDPSNGDLYYNTTDDVFRQYVDGAWYDIPTSGGGSVNSVSVDTANGFAGSSSGGADPVLTLETTITGVLQGNGTAISAASTTGSGSVVLATSPSLTTPNIGSATGTASGNTTYTPNNHGVVLSSSTNAMVVIAPDASTSKVLVSGGASANPSWQDISAGALALGSFGSSPNSSGASLSGATLTLQPADATNPGGLSTGTQSIAGAKTFTGNVVIQGSTTLATSLTGPLKAASGVVSASAINLTSEVTGTLPIGNGGTGQTSASAAFNALSPITTAGDLILGNGSNSATRLPIGSNTYVLTSNGTTASWQAPTGSTPVAPTIQRFTSGSGTYNTPTGPTPLYIKIQMIGGGGGGGGSGSAGSSNGGSGGDSTFSTLTAAGGGFGGGTGTNNGQGGTPNANSGSPNLLDARGTYGFPNFPDSNTSATSQGGAGGMGFYAGGGIGGTKTNGFSDTPKAGVNGGGGGGGFSDTTAFYGGGGGASGSYLEHIISSPSATYSYSVGASGSAGGAGTSGQAGAAGGPGLIIVTEYYQ